MIAPKPSQTRMKQKMINYLIAEDLRLYSLGAEDDGVVSKKGRPRKDMQG